MVICTEKINMGMNFTVTTVLVVKACFEIELPQVEFVAIDYLPWIDKFGLAVKIPAWKYFITRYYEHEELKTDNPYLTVKPFITDLKNYLNPLWC